MLVNILGRDQRRESARSAFQILRACKSVSVSVMVNGEDGIELADFMLQDFGEIAVVAARTSCR